MTRRHAFAVALWLAALALAVFVMLRVSQAIQSSVLEKLMHAHQSLVDAIVLGALATYTALIAIPFVPGAEIGMALLTMFGASIAVQVYAATVLGLALSFLAGRLVPVHATTRAMRFLGLTRAADWLDTIAGMPREQIADHLFDRLEPGLATRLIRWRYAALVLLINLPGNSLIGGGGGIAMAAGMSRLFRPWAFLAAVLIAVLPVPLAIILMTAH